MEDFIFNDYCTNDNNQKAFNRALYYKYVYEIITVFFGYDFKKNEISKHLIDLLQDIDNCEDVYILMSVCEPWYWTISISYNTHEIAHIERELITKEKRDKFRMFSQDFYLKNGDYIRTLNE